MVFGNVIMVVVLASVCDMLTLCQTLFLMFQYIYLLKISSQLSEDGITVISNLEMSEQKYKG